MRISPNPVRRLLISKRLAFVYLVFSVIIVLAIGTWFLDLQTDKLLLVKNRSDLASADQIEDVIDHPLEHLIIVPGHSVFIGNDFKNIRESSWFLKSYQRGQTPTLLDQIRRGILETKKDPKSLLLFSG